MELQLDHFLKIKIHKEVGSNQGFLKYFCSERRIPIQEAQKHTDPMDQDPQH